MMRNLELKTRLLVRGLSLCVVVASARPAATARTADARATTSGAARATTTVAAASASTAPVTSVPAAKREAVAATPAASVEILPVPIPARDFAELMMPVAGKSDKVRPLDDERVAISGGKATIEKARALAEQIRQTAPRPRAALVLRAALLASQADTTSPAAHAIARTSLSDALTSYAVTPADLAGLPLPEQVWKRADMSLPFGAGGSSRVALTDYINMTYGTMPAPGGAYTLSLELTENDTAASPFAAAPRRLLMSHQFDIQPGKPVVLGVTGPDRTLVLVLWAGQQ